MDDNLISSNFLYAQCLVCNKYCKYNFSLVHVVHQWFQPSMLMMACEFVIYLHILAKNSCEWGKFGLVTILQFSTFNIDFKL
jgi:hypothetical protein